MKVDKVVKQETLYIGVMGLVFSLVMQAVFFSFKLWAWPVLWGNLFGYAVMLLNYFLMGLTVQKAVGQSTDDAKRTVKRSQMSRMLLLFFAMAVVVAVDAFNIWAGLIPFLFPRIAVGCRMFFMKKDPQTPVANAVEEEEHEE